MVLSFVRGLVLGLALLLGSVHAALAGDSLFQYATIDALLAGLYDGGLTLRDLKYQGGFGLGTLNGLDGELVLLEGQAYHVSAGGAVDVPDDSTGVPWAAVTFFHADRPLALGRVASLAELDKAVFAGLPSENAFCAVRIDGRFPFVKARAIPRQTPPYKPLAEVAKQQVVVNFSGEGTLVGIYSPPFVKGVGVPGFHWHFLTKDRRGGGHVLDLAMEPAEAQLDELRLFSLKLPDDKAFDALDLRGDKGGELRAVEQNHAKPK